MRWTVFDDFLMNGCRTDPWFEPRPTLMIQTREGQSIHVHYYSALRYFRFQQFQHQQLVSSVVVPLDYLRGHPEDWLSIEQQVYQLLQHEAMANQHTFNANSSAPILDVWVNESHLSHPYSPSSLSERFSHAWHWLEKVWPWKKAS